MAIKKVALSVTAWVIAVLVAAAFIEMVTGRRSPSLTSLLALTILFPVLYAIWKK